jgi:beta-glucosidase
MTANINQLVSKMTLEEKAALCSGESFWTTKPLERLGIPSMFVSDGPHGLRKQGESGGDHLGLGASVPATCFPTLTNMASSWNRDLAAKVGKAIALECQAEQVGVLLGPGVNIKRSPLCGRNFEYYSEDPYLAGEMAADFIAGVQSEGVGTSLKHFAVNNQETYRMGVNAVVDERTLMEIYLAAFETPVRKSQPWTVMSSYNRINGEFSCQNEWLLTTVLREMWGFEGFVVTDWGGMDRRPDAVAAGNELEMPGFEGSDGKEIVEAVKNGTLDEEKLDRAITRYLNILFRWEENKRPGTVYDKEAHHCLARSAAGETMVLAKNEGNVLPFGKGDYLVIGEYAMNMPYQGGGSSHINSTKVDNLVEELEKITGSKVAYEKGYHSNGQMDEALFSSAVSAAEKADNVVIVLGQGSEFYTEGMDRPHMKLDDNQTKLVEAVLDANQNTAVVLVCGSSVELPWVDKAKVILVAYLGGQAAGGAVADILTGAVNPSAKFAETWPERIEHNPSYLSFPGDDEVVYSEGIFVGYRYYDKKGIKPLFPFGHGLTYSNFEYLDITVDKFSVDEYEPVKVTVEIKNSGDMDGSEIVQLYVADVKSKVTRPIRELKGFEKVFLKAGETKKVSFTLNRRSFAYWDAVSHGWVVESGKFNIEVGPSSACLPLDVEIEVKAKELPIRPITRNTTVGQIMAIPGGAEIVMQMFQNVSQTLGVGDSSESDQATQSEDQSESPFGGMDMQALLAGMPLRTLATFSGGKMDNTMLEGLIQMLNQKLLGE